MERQNISKQTPKTGTGNVRDMLEGGGNTFPQEVRIVPLIVASKPVRARLLYATLYSLVLPVTFGHVSACINAALALSAAIHFVMKISAPCLAVLCHSPSSWAAILHLSGSMPKILRPSRRHPIYSFSCLHEETAPPTSSPNITHFGNLVSSCLLYTSPSPRDS